MCGIVGYLGKNKAVPVLLAGLHALEYRGYDSAGLAVFDHGEIICKKAVGSVTNLEEKIRNQLDIGDGLGIAHCLHPSTVVQLSNGKTLAIKDLPSEGVVSSVDPQKQILVQGKFKKFKHQSPEYLYEVRTPVGSFTATPNHKTLVYEAGSLIAKQVRGLKRGDMLPLPKKITVRNSKPINFKSIFVKRYYRLTESGFFFLKKEIKRAGVAVTVEESGVSTAYVNHVLANDRNFREDQLQALYQSFGEDFEKKQSVQVLPVNTIHGKFIRTPQTSSPRLMQIFGYFIGDGYAGKRSLRFKDPNTQALEHYKILIQEEFNIEGRIANMKDTAAKLLEVNSAYLCSWIKENINKDKARFISTIGCLPNRELAAFIRGLFDAEGGVGQQSRQLFIGMNNEFLIRSLQLWLLRFGIISSFRVEKANVSLRRPNPNYRLSVSSKESLQSFLNEIGFSNQDKVEKLKGIIERVGDRKFSFRNCPTSDALILSKVIEVKKVKADVGEVYDLEVSGHPNFLANGIFTHNSRWATHGGVTEANAHPHTDCYGNIYLVHNGIIENYKELREKLNGANHQFTSETDTEVIAHLIEEIQKSNNHELPLEEAVRLALGKVQGTYGLVIIDKREPKKIVAARNFSPLIFGMGQDEFIIASDATPIMKFTDKVIYLNDGEIATITPSGYRIQTIQKEVVRRDPEKLDWDLESAEKGTFADFMLKEINEEPEAVRNSIRGRINLEEGKAVLGGLTDVKGELRNINRLHICACGSAYLAGKVGQYMLEEYAGVPVEIEFGSEMRYRKPIFEENDAFLAVSQSGETADTLASLYEAKEKEILTLGIVNAIGSTASRETDAGVYQHIGPEVAVASTKSFVSQVAILTLLTLFLGRKKDMSLVMGQRIATELQRLPALMDKILAQQDLIKELAEKYSGYDNFLYLGRKYNYPIALEGALKIKEIAYVHAEGYASGEMKHGPIALIDKKFPSIVIVPRDSVYEKNVSNMEELKARGGPVVAVATEGDKEIKQIADDVIYIPKTLEMLTPILSVVPLHLFAYFVAVKRGLNVDRPRNLAKSVTVE